MSRKFRKSIVDHCDYAVDAMMSCSNEQAVKNYLIDPFLLILGYDTREPGIVVPESSVIGRDGNKGRVDYAIQTDDGYQIAIECKPLSSKLQDEQGQLRRYFQAIDGCIAGILTNGIIYHVFTNVDMEHSMDAEPFATIDIKSISENGMQNEVYEIIEILSRENFDKATIHDIAKMKLIEKRLHSWWLHQMRSPSDDLCRLALRQQGIGRITQRMIDSFRPMVLQSFIESLGLDICEKISERGGSSNFVSSIKNKLDEDPRIITTDRELEVFHYCKAKLAHHTNSIVSFDLIQKIDKRDWVEKFSIYFKQVNKGRILDFYELGDGQERFQFPNGAVFYDLSKIDDALVTTFLQRVKQYEESVD